MVIPSHLPATDPPPGKVSNFDDPPNFNAVAYFTLSLALALSTFVLVLRIYSRWFVIRKPSVVDYCLIIAYLLNIPAIAITLWITGKTGLFVHLWDIRLIQLPSFFRDASISALVVIAYTPILKAAILFEWIRIFSPGSRDFVFWSCHFLIWSNVICYFVFFVCLNVACTPYEYNWNKMLPGGTCKENINTAVLHEATAAINLFTDVLISLIPQQAIWKLQMTRQRKLGVAGIFAIGILGIAAAAGRIAASVIWTTSTDFTYTTSTLALCVEAEWACSMLVVCGPAVPQAFASIRKRIDTMRTLRKESKTGYGDKSATPSLPSMPPAKLRPARTGYEDLEDGSILRQTAFATEEEYIDATSGGNAHGRQHPWTVEK
ncbi:hypothetical protein QBC38DRAFT_368230 [Podospora fimiseda]|uniref:Rhodopsin domain-containing protein n=1 Tax=Podospora fimiseda TaxID=252190 RepID=A0AAN7BLJ5_9PEZI|nr:hypothetical protein QBC38DRAFT_368230 [Podospora fimiseda]